MTVSLLVVHVEDTQRKRQGRFVFERSPVHVGRSALNDVVLPLPLVSLWHGVIKFDDEAIRFVDTGSSNGSVINGRRVTANEATEVGRNQKVVIGPLELKLFVEQGGEGAGKNNLAQQELLFGEAKVEAAEAVGGRTMFVQALQVKPASPVEQRLSSIREQMTRANVSRKRGEPSAESTVMMAAEEPAEANGRAGVFTAVGPAAGAFPAFGSGSFGALDESYVKLQAAMNVLQRQLAQRFAGKPEAERRALLAELAARYPKLNEANMLAEWGGRRPPPATPQAAAGGGGGGDGGAGLRLINQFAASYVPRRQNLESEAQLERFLDRVAQVLETFAKGFIELRRGYEAFSEEMGVGSVTRRDSRVASFDKIPKVLEYLLDEAQSEARVAELTRGFADVMIHQVALVGGIRRGVRAALDRISPDSIVELAKRGGGSFIEALAPAQKRWTLYVEQHRDLAEDEEQLTQVLFGKDFARAYAVIARGGGDSDEEGEAD